MPQLQTTTRSVFPLATVLLIGPWEEGELAIAHREIEFTDVAECDDCASAVERLTADEISPELILLAQPLSGTYQQQDIEALRHAAPLAQLVVVAGTWCEGELRTGTPLRGVMRIYWYELISWCKANQDQNVPFISTLEGPFAPRSKYFEIEAYEKTMVAIHTPWLANFDAISAGLTPFGIDCHWLRPSGNTPPDTSVIIWDGGQLDPREFSAFQSLAAQAKKQQMALVALLDFPRKEHFDQLGKLGCQTILGKPYIIDELAAVCGLASQHSPIF